MTKKGAVQILSDTDFVSVEKNLIYKVGIFIKKKFKVKEGAEVELEKKIPISAGLGGGSSNAASTIIALNKIWDLHLTPQQMHHIAAEFGSDINFFLHGGTAIGENRGEKIVPADDIELNNIFLVNPGFGISSKEAYENVEITTPNKNWNKILETGDVKFCFNKLESGISKLYPEITNIIKYLNENGAAKAMLSGSGATVIGFCPNQETAEKFSNHFSKKKYWNCITKTIKRRTK